jgi:hypothetical protein
MLSTASVPPLEETATPAENNTINLPSNALVLREKQACVRSAADIAIPEGATAVLGKHRGYDMTRKQNVSAIVTMPFMAWRAYRSYSRQRRNTIQMLALSCVVRPVDVELRYITPPSKLGVCIGAPDTQTSHDMELSLYLEPLTTSMRARGTQLLQWLRHELATKCMPTVWTGVAAGKRWWSLLGAQTHQAKARQQQEAQSDAIIRLLKTQRLQPW